MSIFNIATYNVLSPDLCHQKDFIHCSATDCDPHLRYYYLTKKLKSLINSNKRTIICLQEVSRKWEASLQVFFARHKYSFITSLYGHKGDGYMGVGIAYPYEEFKLDKGDITRICDVQIKPSPIINRKSWYNALWLRCLTFRVFRWLIKFIQIILMPFYKFPTKKPLNYPNTILTLSFKNTDGLAFRVSTVHVPCEFKKPVVMKKLARLITHHVINYDNNPNYILCGDFNIRPHSEEFKILDNNFIDICQGQVSHTCYVWLKDTPRFQDRIDYIFISKTTELEFEPIPNKEPSKHCLSYPTKKEPSDHILIMTKVYTRSD